MLVLSRKPGEKIHVGSSITITVVQLEGNRVRIGIDAPPEVSICREEIVQARELLGASSEAAPRGENDTSEERLPQGTLCARLTGLGPETLQQQAEESYRRTEERFQALMG